MLTLQYTLLIQDPSGHSAALDSAQTGETKAKTLNHPAEINDDPFLIRKLIPARHTCKPAK